MRRSEALVRTGLCPARARSRRKEPTRCRPGTYWLVPGRRVVLLTVFRKTKMREQAEVDRAHAAQQWCEAEHEAAAEHDLYSRNLKENR